MKAITILSLFLAVSCVTNKHKARAVSSEGCNITNYRDFIDKEGFHRCNLKNAKLRDADLQGAYLRQADLRRADLQGADLREADLRQSDLTGADLREADLRGADLRWAYLIFANLIEADLRGADLRRTGLKWANLSKTKVTVEQAGYLTAQGFSGFVIVE